MNHPFNYRNLTMTKYPNIFLRSFMVGIGYIAGYMVSGIVLRLIGFALPIVKDSQIILQWTFVGGVIVGIFLGPIAASMSLSRTRHILIWSSILLFNLISVVIEGYFFAPDMIGDSLPALIIQLMLVSFVTGWVVTLLFAPNHSIETPPESYRSIFSWIWRFLLSAFSYVFFYFVFGALNYALVTKPYYESHTGGLDVPSPQTVMIAEVVRGYLIILSIFPFLISVRSDNKRVVFLSGLILFSIGGLVPLTMQVNTLLLFLLAASAVEIFFQNFLTGAVAASLLGRSVQ